MKCRLGGDVIFCFLHPFIDEKCRKTCDLKKSVVLVLKEKDKFFNINIGSHICALDYLNSGTFETFFSF